MNQELIICAGIALAVTILLAGINAILNAAQHDRLNRMRSETEAKRGEGL